MYLNQNPQNTFKVLKKIPKSPEGAIRQLAPLVGHEMRALGEGQLVQVQVLAPGHLLAHLSALQFGLKDC